MIDFNIVDKVYSAPSSWEEVTVAMFENLLDVSQRQESFSTEIAYSLAVISALTKIPVNILEGLEGDDFSKLGEAVSWSGKEIISNRKKEFLINGITYVPVSNYNGLTMGEAIDSEMIIKNAKPSNLISELLPLLVRRAIYKGKGKKTKLVPSKFDVENYQELKEEMKHNLMITDVMQLKGFF